MKEFRKKQICGITGITSETLRYYVERKIITPEREENGRYYSYSLGDAAMILLARQMRGFGAPMDEIPGQMLRSSKSWEEYTSVLKETHEDLLQEKKRIELLLRILTEQIGMNNLAYDEPFLYHSGSKFYAAFYDGTPETMEAVCKLQQFLPRSTISFRLRPHLAPEIGLTVTHDRLSDPEKKNLIPCVLELGRERVLMYKKYDNIETARAEDFQRVMEFCDYHRFRITSDVFCVALRLYERDGRTGCELVGGVTYATDT